MVPAQVSSRRGEAEGGEPGADQLQDQILQEELGDAVYEKDRSVRPWGRRASVGMVMDPGIVQLWWRLSPLFSQGGQILFFPALISYLGEPAG
jgi:hypothetical protein